MLRAGDAEGVNNLLGQVKKTYDLLGLFRADPDEFIASCEAKQKSDVPEEVTRLVQLRAEAKARKDWAEADALRAKITQMGYSVKDTKDGAVVEKL